ncbi:MAG: hypothetical protein J6A78_07615 [Clostridia bacterium]|nr:hypothetical protein [Clostridia bacterium]
MKSVLEREAIRKWFVPMNCILFVYFLELVFPPVTVIVDATWVCAICMALWLFLSFIIDARFYLNLNYRSFLALVFLVFSIFLPRLFGVTTIGNRYVGLGLLALGPIIFEFYKKHGMLRALRNVIFGIIPFITITLTITLYRLIEDPWISRSIKTSDEYSESLAREGVGGYGFIYFMVVITPVLLYIFLNSKLRRIKLLTACAFILSVFFILKSNYVTALLIAILASAVMVLYHIIGKNKGNIAVLILILIVAVLLLSNINVIVNTFADIIPKRIAKVLVTEDGTNVFVSVFEEFVIDRWPVMKTSIDGFFENPLFGMITLGNNNLADYFFSGFGQHSHILDTFSLLGVFGGIINLIVVFRPFRDENGKWVKGSAPLTAAMLVCVVGIYLFNNATSSIALATSIIFPLLREYYINPSAFKAPRLKEDA